MDAQNSVAPVIIIKRKKVIDGGGHHGGAWKVAYADFVTAMMAFFMLMWLLNATTESQRKGIADYFSPTIPLSRVSGGGDGAFGGDSMFSEETLARNGTGASDSKPTEENQAQGSTGVDDGEDSADSETNAQFAEIESMLVGGGGESMILDNALRHVDTRLTDEGLIIEIFDLVDDPLFIKDTSEPTEIMINVTTMLVDVFQLVTNEVAINGHTRSSAIVLENNPSWDLSSTRADQTRKLLEHVGLEPKRIQRVTGFADRKPKVRNLMAVRNNRLEIILLRSDL